MLRMFEFQIIVPTVEVTVISGDPFTTLGSCLAQAQHWPTQYTKYVDAFIETIISERTCMSIPLIYSLAGSSSDSYYRSTPATTNSDSMGGNSSSRARSVASSRSTASSRSRREQSTQLVWNLEDLWSSATNMILLGTLLAPHASVSVEAAIGLAFSCWLHVPDGFSSLFPPLSDRVFYVGKDGNGNYESHTFRKGVKDVMSALKRKAHLVTHLIDPAGWDDISTFKFIPLCFLKISSHFNFPISF
jgi:hypothetical protein